MEMTASCRVGSIFSRGRRSGSGSHRARPRRCRWRRRRRRSGRARWRNIRRARACPRRAPRRFVEASEEHDDSEYPPPHRGSGRSLRAVASQLLFLRVRRRRRFILRKFPFCMKGLLYKMASAVPRKDSIVRYAIPHRDVPRPGRERLRLPEHRQQRTAYLRDDRGQAHSRRPLLRPGLPGGRRPLRPSGRAGRACPRGRRSVIRSDPEEVALTQNTTHGMNLGVASIDWRQGDEVSLDHDRAPGMPRPPPQPEGARQTRSRLPLTPEKLEAAITPKTRLVALSHVD